MRIGSDATNGSLGDVGARVEIYTDGACRGNPGPGGWAAVLRWRAAEKELSGGDPRTTNNRMELMAAIQALEALKWGAGVDLFTDSRYLRDGITDWIRRWKCNGWKTASKAPVKNAELWRRLDAALARHEVSWHWIAAHSGHPENERADYLAREAADRVAGSWDAGGCELVRPGSGPRVRPR